MKFAFSILSVTFLSLTLFASPAFANPDLTRYLLLMCRQAGPLTAQCNTCASSNGVWTAIGCVNVTENNIANSLLQFVVAISGGFALLFMLLGAFQITTSTGNPDRLDQGKQTIISAVIGLVFIILAVAILEFIGVHILQIPGF